MKVTNTKTRPDGRRVLTVEVGKDEDLIGIEADGFYRLGYPLEEKVVSGHMLHCLQRVTWCSVDQKWV